MAGGPVRGPRGSRPELPPPPALLPCPPYEVGLFSERGRLCLSTFLHHGGYGVPLTAAVPGLTLRGRWTDFWDLEGGHLPGQWPPRESCQAELDKAEVQEVRAMADKLPPEPQGYVVPVYLSSR